jgi:arabinofuranan 3-O-arabinosyltransferase
MIEAPRDSSADHSAISHGFHRRMNWWFGEPPKERPPATGATAERLRHSLWLVACCLLLAMLAFLTRPGNIIGDTKIDMALDPAGFLLRSLHLWDPIQFGELQNQSAGYFFPMGPFFVLGKLMALPAWVVQRLWLTAIFVAVFLGVVRLAARLGIGTPAGRMLAGLGYALCPIGLSSMGILSAQFLPEAMLPWILLPLVSLMRDGAEMTRWERARAIARSAVAVALCSGINAAAVAAVLLPAVIYLLAARRSWCRGRVLCWWTAGVALATAWWTIPLVLLGRYGVSILPYSESAAVTTSVTSLSNAFRGTEYWLTYLAVNGTPWWPVGFQLSSGAVQTILTGIVAGIGLAGLASQRLAERRFLLLVLLAGICIVSTAYVSGLGNPLAASLDHVINGPLAPLRNLAKFDPMVRLPIALGVAQLLGSVRWPRVRTVASLAAAAGLAGLALPAYTGGIAAAGDFPSVPSYWASATSWLNQHAGNQAVLAVPGARFGEYIWGRPMDDLLEAMFAGDWAGTQLATIGSVGSTRLLDAVEQQVEAGVGSAGLTQVLARMGVKYIIVRNDLIRSDLYGAWPARVLDALYSSPGIAEVAHFGTFPVGGTDPDDAVGSFDTPYPPVEIFKVGGVQPEASVVPTAGTMRVYGGPESLLTLADYGRLQGRPMLLNSEAPELPASEYLVTNSLRKIVRNFGDIRVDYSPTLTAVDPAQTIDAATDYLEPSWRPYLSAAQYHGIASVTASSSASDIAALPNQSATGLMPFSAIDGNPLTMWESGALTGPLGQWLQVDFERPVAARVIQVAFADSSAVGPSVTRVNVQTSAGSVTDVIRPTNRSQPLTMPRGMARWLRITITRVAASPYGLAGTQVGIAEISVPGVTASRAIIAPDVHIPAGAAPAVLLAKAQPQPSDCMLTSLRWVCSPELMRPTEEQYGFDEAFTAGRSYQATLLGQAVLTNTKLIAHYAWPGRSQPQVTASSTYTSDPQDMARSAFDGNLATSWIASSTDRHPVLTIRWHRMRTVSHLTFVLPPSAASPLQVLLTGSHGQLRGGVIGASGQLKFRPLRTSELRFTFTPAQLPLQISEIQVRGVTPLAAGEATAQVHLGCSQGPTLRVDGQNVATRATGTFSDLLDGRPMPFSACSPVAVKPGGNGVVEAAADPTGFDVQSVLLSPPGSLSSAKSGGSGTMTEPVTTVRWTAASRVLRVSVSQRSYLVVNQNFNVGWQASVAGRVLTPLQLDGWKQGWLLPAGTSGLVTLTYLPDAPYRLALFSGLGALGLVIVVALAPLRRRRLRLAGSTEPADTLPQAGAARLAGGPLRQARNAGLAGGILCAIAFVGLWLGGYPGAALVPVATAAFFLASRYADRAQAWRVLASRWLLAALMTAAAVGGGLAIATHQWGSTGGFADALWDKGPQLAGLLIVARLTAELLSSIRAA